MASPAVARISRFRVSNVVGGITMEVDLVLKYGYPIPELMNRLRANITREIEWLTSLNVKRLTLAAKSIVV